MDRKSVYTTTNDFDRESNGQIIPGQWRAQKDGNGLMELQKMNTGRTSITATAIRDSFKQYFISQEGEVCWQYTACGYPHQVTDTNNTE